MRSEDDGHPLAVYAIDDDGHRDDDDGNEDDDNDGGRGMGERRRRPRTPVLLLHGRTWSSLPVYHLASSRDDDDDDDDEGGGEDRSLLRALHDTRRIVSYAMDFRGFGGTPRDSSGYAEPLRCVSDAMSVLNWIHKREGGGRVDGDDGGYDDGRKAGTAAGAVPHPALLGWSHGALIAQIIAQRHSDAISKLIL